MSKEPAFRSFPRSRSLPARSKRDNEINDAIGYSLSLSPHDYTRGIALESSQLFLEVPRVRGRKEGKKGKEYSEEKDISVFIGDLRLNMQIIGHRSISFPSRFKYASNTRDLSWPNRER
jgi:hypothetical protein